MDSKTVDRVGVRTVDGMELEQRMKELEQKQESLGIMLAEVVREAYSLMKVWPDA